MISSSRDETFRTVAYPEPPAIKKYLEEEDRYKAFLAGQRQIEDDKGQTTIRKMLDWSKAWKHEGGNRRLNHGKPHPQNFHESWTSLTAHSKA